MKPLKDDVEAPPDSRETADQRAGLATPSSNQGEDDPFDCQSWRSSWELWGGATPPILARGNFLSPFSRDAIIPYWVYLGKVSLKVSDWTHYDGQDNCLALRLATGTKGTGPYQIATRGRGKLLSE